MEIIRDIESLQTILSPFQGTIGFVPTMGALHDGHLSLVQRSVSDNDLTVVSIYVNPAQFGPDEDFDQYPRTFESDSQQLRELGADIIFLPSHPVIYPDGLDQATQVVIPELMGVLCGQSRPHFFQGVCTVVLRLFNIIYPDKAYFGEKDYQQLFLIQKMVQDLFLDIDIVPMPTIREADGLAMSSRNAYLSADEREQALGVFKALQAIHKAIQTGTSKVTDLYQLGHKVLEDHGIQEDYITIMKQNSLDEQTQDAQLGDRLFIAGQCGQTRLIDNLLLS